MGGATYLAELFDVVASSTNVEHHAKIVHEKAILRNIIEVCQKMAVRAYQDEDESTQLLDEAEQSIFGISDKRLKKGFTLAKELVTPHHQDHREALPREEAGHRH